MKTLNLMTAGVLLLTSISALAGDPCIWPELKKLESGNLVSTYTFDYWDFAKKNMPDYFKDKDLFVEGPVIGDFHFSNVGVYFNSVSNKVDFAIVDLDDSGTASLFADYLKYLAYLRTISKDFDQKSLLKNYKKGIRSDSYVKSDVSMPSEIEDLFKKKASWFAEKNQSADQNKMNSNGTGFKKKQDLKSISTLNSGYSAMIDNLNSQLKVLDSGFKMNESGSSMGSMRFLVLGESQGQKHVFEFKELRCAGTEMFETQKNQTDRFSEMKKAFRSENFWGSDFIATAFDSDSKIEKTFVFRKKQENPLDDLAIDKMKKEKLVKYGEYYAFLLGYFHAPFAKKSYADAIDKNQDKIADRAEKFAKDYIDHLKKKTHN